jgi:hypothetical protein
MNKSITFEPFNRAVIQLAVSDAWFHTDQNNNRMTHWFSVGRGHYAKTEGTRLNYRSYKLIAGPLCINVGWNT